MEIVNFTPLPALFGGILIGIASAILMAFNGKIFGISGIIGGIIKPEKGETPWRIVAVVSMILGAFIMHKIEGTPEQMHTVKTPVLIIGGLLMGYGARLGSGCTSGHGVCGLSRLSVRSLISTLTFMGSGMILVFLSNLFGWH